jgi:PKD repeat protein/uncharacterized protein YraI
VEALPRVIRRPQNTLVIYNEPVEAYKLLQHDVTRIERRYGTPIDFLGRAKLTAALREFNLQPLALDAEDLREVEAATGQTPSAPLGVQPPPSGATAKPVPPAAPAEEPPPPTGSGPSAGGAGWSPPDSLEPVEGPDSSGLRRNLLIALGVVAVAIIALAFVFFRMLSGPGAPGAGTGTPIVETTTPTVTTTPGLATATARVNTAVTSGPGPEYDTIGILQAGQTVEVTGRSEDSQWWVVRARNLSGGQGWVTANAVTTTNAEGVPVVVAPELATPTPSATPTVAIIDWKGEYFDNPDVTGEPVLVRNDPAINFNWGPGSPAPGVPPNDYSVRWSRADFFEDGSYLFRVNVEGGARLWLDGRLLIDSWQSEGLRLLEAESGPIGRGDHDLRVDYFKRSGSGQIAVGWEPKAPDVPPTALITGPTAGQTGEQLRFTGRNSSPGSGKAITAYEWRFGDGTVANGADVQKTFATPGNYEVRLAVTADNGLQSVAIQQVRITEAPLPPVAVISAPSQAVVSQTVTFNGGNSTGQNQILDYRWNFGDGGTANAVTVDHAYASGGVYNVTLTVTDSAGLSDTSTMQIQVSAATPTPSPTPTPAGLTLEGMTWQLRDTIPGSTITAFFRGGTVNGQGGCNSYNGSYTVSGENLAVGSLSTSGQLCSQEIMDQETQYLAALTAAQRYAIEGSELRITTLAGGDQTRLVYVAAATPR